MKKIVNFIKENIFVISIILIVIISIIFDNKMWVVVIVNLVILNILNVNNIKKLQKKVNFIQNESLYYMKRAQIMKVAFTFALEEYLKNQNKDRS